MSDIKAVLNSDNTIKAVMNTDKTLKSVLNSSSTLKSVINTSLTVNQQVSGGDYIHFTVTQDGSGQIFTDTKLLQYSSTQSINLMKNGVYIEPSYYTKPTGESIQINIYLETGDEIDILATGSAVAVPTAPGTDKNVLYNNQGVMSGSNNFTFDGSNVTITGTYFGNINGANVIGSVSSANSVSGANVVGTVGSASTAYSVNGSNVVGAVGAASTAYSVNGGNVSGAVSLATTSLTSGTVTTNSQPNITSTGTLTSLTVNGLSSVKEIKESFVVDATAPTGTVNLDVLSSAILYKTANATANFTLNIRGNNTTTLNSILGTGESFSVTLIYNVGTTVYSPTTVSIDGTTQTVKYPGGITPAPTASSTNLSSFTILKTNTNTYTVIGNYGSFL